MNNWQLKNPLDAILFDCDGTLSRLEGIVALARQAGQEAYVAALTEKAMGSQGLDRNLYRQRLDCVRPNQQQVEELGQWYIDQLSEDVFATVQALQAAGKKIYVLSAGLLPSVLALAKYLNIPAAQVFAVPIKFNSAGEYENFDEDSPLCNPFGKAEIAQQIKKQYPRIALVGDGQNDFQAAQAVERFIGYGGNFFRQNLMNACEFYIRSKSLSPVLSLCLTVEEIALLPTANQEICIQAQQLLIDGQVKTSLKYQKII